MRLGSTVLIGLLAGLVRSPGAIIAFVLLVIPLVRKRQTQPVPSR